MEQKRDFEFEKAKVFYNFYKQQDREGFYFFLKIEIVCFILLFGIIYFLD